MHKSKKGMLPNRFCKGPKKLTSGLIDTASRHPSFFCLLLQNNKSIGVVIAPS